MYNNSPFPMNVNESPRMQLYNQLKSGACHYELPIINDKMCTDGLARIAWAINSLRGAPFDLALLGSLSSIAAADRGKHKVRLSNGMLNSLSMILVVGAESGSGKSRALVDGISTIRDYERTVNERLQEENEENKGLNELTKVRLGVAKQIYAKSMFMEAADWVIQEKRNIVPMHKAERVLMDDVTGPSYTQSFVRQGYAMRLESDGQLLPDNTMRVVNKAWEGESVSRERLTVPDGVANDPFVMDVVFTQPEFFRQEAGKKNFIASGRLARTLLYNSPSGQPNTKKMLFYGKSAEEVVEGFRRKLKSLLHESENREHKLITLTPEAEDEYNKMIEICAQARHEFHRYHAIVDYVVRIPQHTLRLAGAMQLAEYDNPSEVPVPLATLQRAYNMAWLFADQAYAWRLKDYGDVSIACCQDVMMYILKKNLPEVLEKELKQALKSKYKAADIDVALYYLQLNQWLVQKQFPSYSNPMGGRPKGRIFVNQYYELYGIAF